MWLDIHVTTTVIKDMHPLLCRKGRGDSELAMRNDCEGIRPSEQCTRYASPLNQSRCMA